MGSGVRCTQHLPDDRSRVAVDSVILRPVPRLPANARRSQRIQRQVHGGPDRAARRQCGHPGRACSTHVSQLFPPCCKVAVFWPAACTGRMMLDFTEPSGAVVTTSEEANAATLPTQPSAFEHDLLTALAHEPRRISPKYFYDAAGSALFDRICELPEYYPTRTEVGLLQRHAADIAALSGAHAEIVEFGAGSLHKIRLLLNALDTPKRFVPIDISTEHLGAAAELLRSDHPRLVVQPVGADYTRALNLPEPLSGHRTAHRIFPRLHHRQFHHRRSGDLSACCRNHAARWRAAVGGRLGEGAGTAACGLQRCAGRHSRIQPELVGRVRTANWAPTFSSIGSRTVRSTTRHSSALKCI